jgi:hypothetical protein
MNTTARPVPSTTPHPAPAGIQWNCQLGAVAASAPATSTTDSAGAAGGGELVSEMRGLTVGQSIHLVCSGPEVPLTPSQLHIEIHGAEAKTAHFYQLKLMTVTALKPGSLDAVVASYETGEHPAKDIFLTDGQRSVELTGFEFSVQTVIKQEGGQAPPPFGPIGPLKLTWSWGIIAPVLVSLLLILLLLLQFFKRRIQEKNWKEQIANFRTARRPLDELFGDLRSLDRKLDFNKDQPATLGKDLRFLFDIFLVRTFSIPAHVWKVSRIINAVSTGKGSNRKVVGPGALTEPTIALVQRTLVELRALEKRVEAIASADVLQVVQLIRKTADLIVSELDRRSPK